MFEVLCYKDYPTGLQRARGGKKEGERKEIIALTLLDPMVLCYYEQSLFSEKNPVTLKEKHDSFKRSLLVIFLSIIRREKVLKM